MTHDVLVAGETLVDVVSGPDGSVVEQPGGSAANAAVALARLGVPASLATSWGDDERGAELADHLAVEGVRVVGDPVLLTRTSTAHASVGDDGAAHYEFDVAWDLPEVPGLEPPRVLMLSSLAPLVEPGATKVRELLARVGTTSMVVYDLNIRPGVTGIDESVRRAAEHVAAQAQLVKASDEDLAALWPDLGLVAAAHHLLRLGARGVVVTRGPAGAMWVQAGRLVAEPAVHLDHVADTIGAGDTFGAALVAWLLEHVEARPWDELLESEVRAALSWAARAAAITVSRPGADPPTRADLEAAAAYSG